MFFDSIYEKLDKTIKDVDYIKKLVQLNNDGISTSFGSLQSQCNEIKKDINSLHKVINDLCKMFAVNKIPGNLPVKKQTAKRK